MKTLKNHTLIYDDECPMCKIYSGAFIRCGMLDNDGRISYDKLQETLELDLDLGKARNEITLINKENKQVLYGIDSLFMIIGHCFPVLNVLFKQDAFKAACRLLYRFISYNRNVIAPGSSDNRCIPDFNFKYRWTYILFA
ncbi:DUF393 domain-containing protein [Fulvivirga sp. 29W222]|uniref:DUF393 domain-containing protein n=1 Tax=Fulvivirga marina TaxID=2494733 RepID=A0A937FWH0_9BACT|nr:DCC1-like thiol-disulfide oxidoreductase family protein [Fulvivirga marina]MBL6446272.1 DUF393 domain-containing protein [Fulvivirga marina]